MPRRSSWTLEKVLAEIQALHAAGEQLTYAYLISCGYEELVRAE